MPSAGLRPAPPRQLSRGSAGAVSQAAALSGERGRRRPESEVLPQGRGRATGTGPPPAAGAGDARPLPRAAAEPERWAVRRGAGAGTDKRNPGTVAVPFRAVFSSIN